jgi:hypothetical protein
MGTPAWANRSKRSPRLALGCMSYTQTLEPGYAEQPADRQFGRREATIPPTFQQRLGTS